MRSVSEFSKGLMVLSLAAFFLLSACTGLSSGVYLDPESYVRRTEAIEFVCDGSKSSGQIVDRMRNYTLIKLPQTQNGMKRYAIQNTYNACETRFASALDSVEFQYGYDGHGRYGLETDALTEISASLLAACLSLRGADSEFECQKKLAGRKQKMVSVRFAFARSRGQNSTRVLLFSGIALINKDI